MVEPLAVINLNAIVGDSARTEEQQSFLWRKHCKFTYRKFKEKITTFKHAFQLS